MLSDFFDLGAFLFRSFLLFSGLAILAYAVYSLFIPRFDKTVRVVCFLAGFAFICFGITAVF